MPLTPERVDGTGCNVEYPPDDPRPKPRLPAKVFAAADTADVMREQLELLIQFARQHPGPCDCDLCARFVGVRNLLMKPFAKTERVAKAGA